MIKPGMFISDRYEIIDKVGSGGMADVYKAKCHRLNRYVAIKILRSEYSNDKSFVAKFRAEAQSVAGLSHPNIVNVYDVGEDSGLYYIVMELVEGITLKKFVERKGRLEVKEAVGIAIQIALGMEAAHEAHIIHRDIKPQNIIISRDGKVKVTDFGIAKAATSNTLTSNAMGSVHYLSPEQARGGYSDERSDIYSLGVTLYEMLCGKVPFSGDNTVSVALLHIQGEAVPVREINPAIPVSVDKIVQKCMQKKPERRYLSASELIADLKRSITNPGGEFVKIAYAVPDSPTISLTADDVRDINKGRVNQQVHREEPVDVPVSTAVRTKKRRQASASAMLEDDGDIDSVDSKVEKVLLGVTISFAIILGIVILYLVIKFFGLFGDNTPGQTTSNSSSTTGSTSTTEPSGEGTTGRKDLVVAIPNVLNLPKEDAERSLRLKSEDFEIIYADEEFSEDIEAGRVMAQYPDATTEVAYNYTITLTLSAGPEPVELRPVRNLDVNYAKAQLEEEDGLKVKVVYEDSNELEKDRVIRTEPEAGELLKKGDTVTLYASNGPSEVTSIVPKLTGTGSTEENAKEKLEAEGLQLGEVKREYSEKPEGEVIAQNTSAGESVAAGSYISITVSMGLEPTSEEDPSEPVSEEDPTDPIVEQPTIYSGTITITDNPFTNEEDTGDIYLELELNGEQIMLYNDVLGYEDFPLTLSFNSADNSAITEGTGIVWMYVNDVLYTEAQWSIKFEEQ